MNSQTFLIASLVLSVMMVCLTVLAAVHVVQGADVVHLATFVSGGMVGIISPQLTNRTTSTPDSVTHTEKVG